MHGFESKVVSWAGFIYTVFCKKQVFIEECQLAIMQPLITIYEKSISLV